ncbi:MAG: HigA family addiction module antitoxin [Anaerolineales bacterium]
MTERRPAEVFHPGEHLSDELEARGWTQVEFAEILGRSSRLVNEIINGKRGISPETARALSAALGTSAKFWMNLDTAYQLWKSSEDVSPIELRAKMRDKYPVRDMTLRGWLRPSEDSRVVESQLLRFFEVDSLDEHPKLAFAARRSNTEDDGLTPIQLAWVYRVKQLAEVMQVPKYSKRQLKASIGALKERRAVPELVRNVPTLLEDCGVRLVIVEPFPSSKIDGVCLWLEDSPVIGLSLRFDRIDNFWFVLRHEIEHVLNDDGKKTPIVDSGMFEGLNDIDLSDAERDANSAAAEFCVSQDELDDFIARKDPYFSRKEVLSFAKRLGVDPGLVVGQLQWKTKRFDLFRAQLVPIRDQITSVAMTDGYGNAIPVEI